jgi:hypothetical protein
MKEAKNKLTKEQVKELREIKEKIVKAKIPVNK